MKNKVSIKSRLGDWFVYTTLILIGFFTIYPIIYVISMSVSSQDAVLGNKVILWPIGFTLDSYEKVLLENRSIWMAYFNTIWYVVVGTAFNLFLTITCAYALSRNNFFARKFFMSFFVFTMLFSGGLIPLFILVNKLGLYDTRWCIVLMSGCSVWNVIITKVFFQNDIPESLFESAKIDGYTDIGILIKIVLPLSKQIIAIVALFCAVSFWNGYFCPMIFLKSNNLKPLQLILMETLIQNNNALAGDASNYLRRMLYLMQIKYVVIIVSIVPIMCVYPFIQKYFVKGVMIGSVKG